MNDHMDGNLWVHNILTSIEYFHKFFSYWINDSNLFLYTLHTKLRITILLIELILASNMFITIWRLEEQCLNPECLIQLYLAAITCQIVQQVCL